MPVLDMLLPTTIVGSMPQPDWLLDRDNLRGRFPPRVRARDIWRVPEHFLQQAQDDATIVAIHEQERAGIDIITDGEMRRESYSNRFATALENVDIDNPGVAMDRSGQPNPVPRIVGKVRRKHPVQVRDVEFLRRHTAKPIKITVPGAFTMTRQAQNEYYKDEVEMVLDYAAALNEEIRDLFAAGADIVQIDDPYLQARPDEARRLGLISLNRALQGIKGATAIHICFGYAHVLKGHDKPSGYSFLPELAASTARQISIEAAQPKLDLSVLGKLQGKRMMVGVLDLADPRPETPDTVASRIRRALMHISPERLVVAPDCGMKYLPRDIAFAKLCAMVEGARIVREELVRARVVIGLSRAVRKITAATKVRPGSKAKTGSKAKMGSRGKAAGVAKAKSSPKVRAKEVPKSKSRNRLKKKR